MTLADLERSLGRRVARMTTNAVVARPRLWGALRWLTRAQFDRLAPVWDLDAAAGGASLRFERALDTLPAAPRARSISAPGPGSRPSRSRVVSRAPRSSAATLPRKCLRKRARQRRPSSWTAFASRPADAAQLPFPPGSVRPRRAREHDPALLPPAQARGRSGRSRALFVLGRLADTDLGAVRAPPGGTRHVVDLRTLRTSRPTPATAFLARRGEGA